jgi:ABC-type transporter Mla subunit MlaD
LVQAAEPVRATVEGLGSSTRQLAESTRHVADSARRSAESLAHVLAGAQEALGAQRHAVEAILASLANALERMRGQGDRLDDMDEKLGQAFDAYTAQVASAVETLFGHVREMQRTLSPALDTMREIVDQAEQFAPQSKRS